jgi:rhomboid family GlyGly-CTERM serine protease
MRQRLGAVFLVMVASLVIFGSAAATAFFQYDRQRIVEGELWRLWTGHFCHFSVEHLAWDLAAFVFLALLLRRPPWILLLAGAVTISVAVFLLQPEIAIYRGLSGLDAMLFVALALEFLQAPRRRCDRPVASVALALFSFKLLFELEASATLFVSSDAFQPLPLAHLIGGLTALSLRGFWPCVANRPEFSRRPLPDQCPERCRRARWS